MSQDEIVVVGGGLAGSLISIMLGRMGHSVTVYEKRPDMRVEEVDGGRSINLALSHRGLLALDRVGLRDQVNPLLIPMKGRQIHDREGNLSFQPYGKDNTEIINSVSRVALNTLLLDTADAMDNVTISFNITCKGFDNRNGELYLVNDRTQEKITRKNCVIIGADGANSAIRQSMMKMGRFNYSQEFLDYGYKELEIPPAEDGGFRIEPNALHIWPRGNFLSIALANPDASFTVTLFAPFEGEVGIDPLTTPEKITAYFEKHFSDLVPHLPTLVEDFENNPTGNLATIRCFPWTKGNAVLIGDAAHAIIPFYGQGMNAAFEDCRILAELIENREDRSWEELFDHFSTIRKINGDAIAQLSYDNFIEMRDKVADPDFLARKGMEVKMYNKFDDIISKYSMVAFHPELQYHEAKSKGEILETTIERYAQEHALDDEALDLIRDLVIEQYDKL
ncbi:MAG: FAD-dependent oxidoreductase [Candidatus Kariarchaeaceae archaeon]|jgi:kynurenine 3-monooxygenase